MGSICHGYMCILLYMKLFGVMVFHGSMVNWRRRVGPIDHRSMLHHYTPYICPRYLCMMLYMKLIQCSGLPWIYGQLEGVVQPADLPILG